MEKNYFYLPLFLIFIFIVGCEKEQIPGTIDEEQKFSIATVQKKDALEFTKKKVSKNIGKQSSLVLFYDQLRYDPIINSDELITVIPAQTKYENVDSRVLLLEINGNIEQVLYNVIPKSSSENIDAFNGRIIITDLDLNFLTGFKVENGYLTSRYEKKAAIEKTSDCDDEVWGGVDMGCNQTLDAVVIKTTKYPSITYIYSDSTMNPYDYDDPNAEQNYYYNGGGGAGSGSSSSSTTLVFNPAKVHYEEGSKPLEEYDDKCEGILRLWELSQNGNEFSAVLTLDGALLITQELNNNGGGINGIYNYEGNTYYQFPAGQGGPTRNYPGQITSNSRYFIPIIATIHSHTPCITDGTDGITNNIITDDQNFAATYPNARHYIVGCNTIGQFSGRSNMAFNIQTGNIGLLCENIK